MGHRDLCRPPSWPGAGCAHHDSSHSPHGAFDNERKCEIQFCCHTSSVLKPVATIRDRSGLERCQSFPDRSGLEGSHYACLCFPFSKKGGVLPYLSQGARERKDSTKSDISGPHVEAPCTCRWEEAVLVGKGSTHVCPRTQEDASSSSWLAASARLPRAVRSP